MLNRCSTTELHAQLRSGRLKHSDKDRAFSALAVSHRGATCINVARRSVRLLRRQLLPSFQPSTNAKKVTVSVLYWYEELFQKHLEQFLGSILFFSFFSAYKHRYKFTFFHVSPVVRCHPSSDKSSRKKRAYGTQDSRVITDLSTN